MKTRFGLDLDKMIHSSALFSCIIFFIAHVAYFIFFLCIHIKPLIYINIASFSFYLLMLILIKYKFYTVYVFLGTGEIALYMSLGAVILGSGSGFNLCLIGLSTLVFFAGFFSKFGKRKVKPVLSSIILMIGYMVIYFYLQYNDPLIIIPKVYERVLYVAHIVIVFGFTVTFLEILTEYTVKLETRISKESETDKLTNIANRKGLANYYAEIGDQQSNYMMVIFDIDNFKSFNDLNGHQCGDYVLKEVARIASLNSKDDFVSRWGGEEFVIVSKLNSDIEQTYKKIDRIRKTVEEYDFIYDDKPLKTTITIGVALYNNEESLEEWIMKADEKLYKGKQNGKNQTVI